MSVTLLNIPSAERNVFSLAWASVGNTPVVWLLGLTWTSFYWITTDIFCYKLGLVNTKSEIQFSG